MKRGGDVVIAGIVVLTTHCGSNSSTGTGADGGMGDGATSPQAAVGDPCIPFQEISPSFGGFNVNAVTLEEGNSTCGPKVCLVNHFQGRVSCPYGQAPPTSSGFPPCLVPGTSTPVMTGSPRQTVEPQCLDRTASEAVYCSCRCANAAGKTDDGASYCTCPSGFSCTQVIPPLVSGDPNAGAYCITQGTAFDPYNNCGNVCSPMLHPCASVDAGISGETSTFGWATYFTEVVQGIESNMVCTTPLPADVSGKARCTLFVYLSSNDTCSAHPGLTLADPLAAAAVLGPSAPSPPPPVCVLPQLAAPCTSSSQPGWCYATGSAAHAGCAQSLAVSPSGAPPSNAGVVLGCF
jgi:hypothetical protein